MEKQAKASLEPDGSKLILLYSSMSGSLEVKARQNRVQSILDGLHLPDDAIEKVNGADPVFKARRLELFVISGKTAQYPQLFLASGGVTKYIGNAQDIFDLHDNDVFAQTVGLVVHDTAAMLPSEVATESAEAAMAEEDDEPAVDYDDPKFATTTWARAPSTRHMLKPTTQAGGGKPEDPLSMLPEWSEYQGSEQHEKAVTKIQNAVRVRFLPILVLEKKLRNIKEGANVEVGKIQKDTHKKIEKIQKKFDKDRAKVAKYAKDIKRYEKKNKQLKAEVKAEKKIRDGFKKAIKQRDKEQERNKKYSKKRDKYAKKLEKQQKMAGKWDKDIKAVQVENEKLLGCIANISQTLAMAGVNWTQLKNNSDDLSKAKQAQDPIPTSTPPTSATVVHQGEGGIPTEQKKGTDEVAEGGQGRPLATAQKSQPSSQPERTIKSNLGPARVPPRSRLQSMMRRDGGRRSVVAMVKQESQRFGVAKEYIDKAEKEDGEAAPVYFVRLNSRARLVS